MVTAGKGGTVVLTEGRPWKCILRFALPLFFGSLLQQMYYTVDAMMVGRLAGEQALPEEIRRANAVTPLTAVQSEYSMMERMFEKEVIPLCGELGIGFVPFSPLASGFLSGKYGKGSTYSGDDVRRVITRFSEENVAANQPLLDMLYAVGEKKGATPAQVSLAWMLHKKDFIVPIPGMRRDERFVENFGAADVVLTEEEYETVEKALSQITVYGNQTDADIAKLREMYALDRPGVVACLAGAVTAKEMEETLRFYDTSLEERDYSFIGALQKEDMVGVCTYCGHCMPCPQKIEINAVSRYYDLAKASDPMAAGHYQNLSVYADACVQCGHCREYCPFHVDMPERMKEIDSYFIVKSGNRQES